MLPAHSVWPFTYVILLNGAISGTKVLSSVPNLMTTFPTPDSTTSPTPNFVCFTLSPACRLPLLSCSPGPSTPGQSDAPSSAARGVGKTWYRARLVLVWDLGERDGILYSRSPQLERSLAWVSVSVSLARVMPT